MATRRDTGFPAQFNMSASPRKKRTGAISGKKAALSTPEENGSGESLKGAGASQYKVIVSSADNSATGRRGTGFPSQLSTANQQSAAPANQQSAAPVSPAAPSSTGRRGTGFPSQFSAANKQSPAPVSPAGPSSTGRRGTGFPSQLSATSQQSAAPVFGQRRQKVHGTGISSIKEQYSTAEARKAPMAKIRENEASSHEEDVVKMRKALYLQQKAKEQQNKKTVVKKRRSMFSASRRVVERVSMYILPKLSLHAAPGKMSAEDDEMLKEYSRDEISKHNTAASTWIIIHGRVYDVTSWMWVHPGREEVLQTNAGKDATAQFEGNFHSNHARDKAKQYVIGKVKGKKLGDLHESVKNKVQKRRNSFASVITDNMNVIIVILSVIFIRLFVVNYMK